MTGRRSRAGAAAALPRAPLGDACGQPWRGRMRRGGGSGSGTRRICRSCGGSSVRAVWISSARTTWTRFGSFFPIRPACLADRAATIAARRRAPRDGWALFFFDAVSRELLVLTEVEREADLEGRLRSGNGERDHDGRLQRERLVDDESRANVEHAVAPRFGPGVGNQGFRR